MSGASLKLGLVGPMPPPNGGMAMQTVQLARLLRGEGIAVEILQTNPAYYPSWVAGVRGLRALCRLLPYLWRVWGLAGRVDMIHVMANSGWSWQLFAAPVVLLAGLRGTPVIVNYRGGEARDYLQRSVHWVRPVMLRASAVVVPSGFLREVFGNFGIPTQVIPNIVDTNAFSPSPDPAAKRSGFTVAVTRNMEHIYGLDIAIRSMAIARRQVPGLRLLVAGSGPECKALAALVEELGLNDIVEFVGRLDRVGVIELYRRADAALNPSRADNMPNSVLEALACGLPVVSTDVGGVSFLVKHGETAILVPPEDEQAMARAIVQLYTDEALRRRLCTAGRQYASQFSWDAIKDRWLSLYQSEKARG